MRPCAPKTLFLDFDGVLHPNLPRPDQRFHLAPMLADAVKAIQVDVVISSSWRFHGGLSALVATLPSALRERIVDTTGPAIIGRFARWQEIRAWVDRNGAADWRALDDSVFEFPPDCPQLIACEGSRGITELELTTLGRWLST